MEPRNAMTLHQVATALFAMLAISIAVAEFSPPPQGEASEMTGGGPL